MNSSAFRTCVCVAATSLMAGSALAGDFGVSFHYGGSYPSCYTVCETRYPSDYTYYDDYYYDDGYPYANYYPARAVVYTSRYPRTYRRTYTRSDCRTYPSRRSGVSFNFNSGRNRHYYSRSSYRYGSTPRIRSHSRSSGSHRVYRSSRGRSHGSTRVRVHRR